MSATDLRPGDGRHAGAGTPAEIDLREPRPVPPAPRPRPLSPWGPPMSGGTRVRGWRRVALAFGAFAMVLVLIAGVVGLAFVRRATGAFNRVEVAGLSTDPGPTHVLVMGSDSRENLSLEERKALTTGYVEGVRTDSMFILSVGDGRAGILSLPRDLWVTRCDGSTGRLNVAMQIGGESCLVQTVRDLTGIGIHHVMQIDFLGFRDLVDAVGGVDLCLEQPIKDKDAGIDLPSGCQTLGGVDALGYVRVRKIDNDLQRIKRQQQFLRALAGKLASLGTVSNPTRVWNLTGAIGAAVTVDQDLGATDLFALAAAVRGMAAGELTTFTVPTEPAVVDGNEVLLVTPAARELFAEVRAGQPLEELAERLVVEDVVVVVHNGAGIEGLATRTADELRELGFQVADVGNAAPPGITVIRHPVTHRAEAELLAQHLPIAPVLQLDDDVTQVTLVLGADWPA